MKYALGNMLNGAGGLNADQLALDLQFAADKTLTARRGPSPILTRTNNVATFVGSNGLIQSAGTDIPRFDHDPVTLACRGLLIEEGRTNVSIRSEELGNAAYGTQALLPVSSNVSVSPDGNTSADKIIENTSTSVHRLFTPQFTATSGVTYTASVFAKSDGRRYLYLNAGSPFNAQTTFDLQNGVVSGTAVGTSSITNFGNGWYRCSVTGTASTTTVGVVSLHINNTVSTAFDDSYLGNGVSGLLLWGVQVEAGSFATSYIPTTTSTLARSADVCSITGANFTNMWNNNEGTVFASGDPRASASFATYLTANSGSNANQVSIYRNTTDNTYGVANSGSYTANIQSFAANGSFNKIAGSYITNNARAAFNSVLGTPDTSVIVPTNLTRLNIGSSGTANSEFANGCVSAIRYYKKSLSNAKLQALTA